MLFLPQLQQVRCRSKVNIQRPRPRHDARRLFEAITVPVYLPESIPHTEVCARKQAQALEDLNEASLVLFSFSVFDINSKSNTVITVLYG